MDEESSALVVFSGSGSGCVLCDSQAFLFAEIDKTAVTSSFLSWEKFLLRCGI